MAFNNAKKHLLKNYAVQHSCLFNYMRNSCYF